MAASRICRRCTPLPASRSGISPTRPSRSASGSKSSPTLPFESQPGERYVYGYSTDILGYVIEKVSGMPLDRYFELAHSRTVEDGRHAFLLPPAKGSRLAAVYGRTTRRGRSTRAPERPSRAGAVCDGPRAAFSGGAGLLSTASDYARFLQMMLNGGELDGVRILSPKTVELMTVNHIGTLYTDAGPRIRSRLRDRRRSGQVGPLRLGRRVQLGRRVLLALLGRSKEQLVAVFMAQLLPTGGSDLQEKLRVLVNQAIVSPSRATAAVGRSLIA